MRKNKLIYNPNSLTIDFGFNAQPEVFRHIWREIETDEMDFPEQHYFIQGKRGLGKTTLLVRLAKHIEENPKPESTIISILFNEEMYGIRFLYQFWEKIFEDLIEKGIVLEEEKAEMDQLKSADLSTEALEREWFEFLSAVLENTGLHLVLLVDNFDFILEKFSLAEIHRFRKILQTAAPIRVIGAAVKVPATFFEYQYPFYEFFKILRLKPLKKTVAIELVQTIVKEDELSFTEKANIETIRQMTNGNTRVLFYLGHLWSNYERQGIFDIFSILMDRLTPDFRQMMENLPTQQQQIVESMALNIEAINVKEMSAATQIPSKIISAQLAQLVKQNLILKIKTSTKNHFYLLKNRLFNYWCLLRMGNNDQRHLVGQLLELMSFWNREMSKDESDRFASLPLSSLPTPTMDSPLKPDLSIGHRLTKNRNRTVKNTDHQLLQLAKNAIQHHQFSTAVGFLKKMKTPDHFLLGMAYHQNQSDYKLAIHHYQHAISDGQTAALTQLGMLYQYQLLTPKKALPFFNQAAKRGQTSALLHLGYYHLKVDRKINKAINYFEQSLDQNTDGLLPLAFIYYHELHQKDQAIKLLEQAATLHNPLATYQLGLIYHKSPKTKNKSIFYFKKTLSHFSGTDTDLSTQKLTLPILTLLKHQQYETVWAFFEAHPSVKKAMLPFYYATAKLYKSDGDEWRRMGREFEEVVMGIFKLLGH